MTPEQIMTMAKKYGFSLYAMHDVDGQDLGESVEADSFDVLYNFAAAVAAAEREACAQLAAATVCDVYLPTGVKIYGTRAAEAIRARGEQ